MANRNKEDIIIELKKEEKEINLTHLIRTFGYLSKCFPNKKEGKEYIYFKSDINKLFQLLKIKVNGKLKINYIYLYSKNSSKDFKNKEKKNSYLEDKNKTTNSIDSTKASFSKEDKSINFDFSKKNYCHYYPKRSEMKERVDKKPCHFPIECFYGVNQHHNEIGNKEYLNLNENNIFNCNNDSYKIIHKSEHLLLNHLCQKNVNKNVIHSFTFRYRHKNSTFLYYN